MLIISAYRVSKRNPENAGSTTTWYQQFSLITAEEREGEPSDAFLEDLQTWLTKITTPGLEIILLLDANKKWLSQAKNIRQ